MKSLTSYLKNVRAELNHVVWPSWQAGVAHTVLIIFISAVIGTFIAGLDFVFTSGVASFITQ